MSHRLLIIATVSLTFCPGFGVGSASAQTPAPTPPQASPAPPPRSPHPGLFGRRQSRTPVGSQTPIAGGIIGNKRTHVYHLAGDTGNLPSEKNRVYFRSEAEARAAGYHPARQRGTGGAARHRSRSGMRRPSERVRPLPSQPAPVPATPPTRP